MKEERRQIRQALHEATPGAIQLLRRALASRNERNAIRAAEIILSHTAPKLSEEVTDLDAERPLRWMPDEQLEAIINMSTSNGEPT